MRFLAITLVAAVLGAAVAEDAGHALFVRTAARQQGDINSYLPPYSTQRPPERPRPFQTASTPQQPSFSPQSQNEVTNQAFQQPSTFFTPPSGGYSTGQPSSPSFVSPAFSGSSSSSGAYSPSSPSYIPPNNKPSTPGFGSSPAFQPQPSLPVSPPAFSGSSSSSGAYSPSSPSYVPPSNKPSTPGFGSSISSGSSTGYQSQPSLPVSLPAFSGSSSSSGSYSPSSPSYISPQNTGYQSSTSRPNQPTPTSSFSSSTGYFSSSNGYSSPSPSPSFSTPGSGFSSGSSSSGGSVVPGGSSTGGSVTFGGSSTVSGGYPSTPAPTPSFPTTGGNQGGVSGSGGSSVTTGSGSADQPDDEDLKHPPHIHAIDVECSKTMMTINIEFNRAFDGEIYSKGYYKNPDCRYVVRGSGETKYSFTVSLDSCGTQFINDFEGEAGQAYLENVLVLQNEPGIQEVWDTIRRVRCLWEGNINKALSVQLSVDMLNQEIVTFSGDTATARLDIQAGKGPFAPLANGLVKIGEIMTLVVSVEGDPGFDLQVRDCLARDETSTNVVQLTDERGCILKPKLFGAFQKTKDTGNTGASIIAYAFFQAFKFPDVMDLFLECNVELCKTDCEACPDPNQQIEPRRRRRDVPYLPTNSSGALSEPVRVGRGFRVIMPEDLSKASIEALEKIEEMAVEEEMSIRNVCMSLEGFYATFTLMLGLLAVTTVTSATLYLKLQKIRAAKAANLPTGH